MGTYKKFRFDLDKALKLKKMSKYALAAVMEIPASRISEINRKDYNPTVSTLNKIAKALNCSIYDLISIDSKAE